ncbi:MAG: STAS domain-containing protein [Phenylobacterium sp.]|uniref:STAS domain-containing protein n=1 Tax=Phenylobacterium sp. TaxID=1871053 RepID=UPI00391CE0A1
MSTSSSVDVEFSGDLTIRSIAEICNHLREALQAHDDVKVSVAEDAEADLTFVQLMESARRSAESDGKRFALAQAAAGGLLETLRRGGFLSERDEARRDFWLSTSGTL